ncbi:hypothetical protein PISL3812_02666 [Talaromyces islandicus]|uniref:Zn(2)-C6 fungal-type domain-containing protein n=1 Tax=Talaromyces islandicus TaxID=28573 RepID=A0A0U1LQX4_TALIS|nr:hypothetical protein PISL3812_02666 [Talaromyces islandicus]
MTPKRVRTVEGSCWLCRDRRVLCDLQQPRCSRCVSKGEACEYGEVRLRWCNGVAARGRYAGQNVPVSITPARRNSRGSRGKTPSSKSENQQGDDGEVPAVQTTFAPVDYNALQVSGLSSHVTAEQLLLYFSNVVVDRFSLSTDRVSINLPSVYEEPALRDSMSAVANAHHVLSLYPGGPGVGLAKERARWSAIHNFRTRLECPSMESRVPGRDLFMANVLLCILDGVIDPHDESAATHMHYRGGRAILSQWKKLQKQLCQEKRGLPALMLSVFATMDLTYSMLSGEEQYFQHTIWNSFAESDGWWGVLPQDDPFLEVLCTLSRLTRLGSLVSKGLVPSEEVLAEDVGTLLMALQSPPELLYDLSCLEGMGLDDKSISPLSLLFASPTDYLDRNQSWVVFCNAYRITGLIYAYRVFYQMSVGDPLVQHAVNLGIQAVCKTRLTGKLSHCLLFPALVIGSHCRSKEDQKAMLVTIQSTAAFLHFGSLRVMESFLQRVWERDPVAETWWQFFEPIAKKAFIF